MKKIICNRVLADASYECRRSLYNLEAKVVNHLLLSDIALGVEFSWERVSYSVTYQYPATNISYLPLPNCSGNFNPQMLQVLCTLWTTLSAITTFYAFELHFVVRVLLHHRLRFNHLPQSRYNPQLMLQYISDWSPGVTASVPFYQENKLSLYESCLLDVLHERILESCLLVSIFI